MLSSISSSDAVAHARVEDTRQTAYRRLPRLDWQTLFGALVMFILFVVAMEVLLKARGIRPTAVDSVALWVQERERASSLQERALILVGDSRMQTDIDLDVLQAKTKFEPIQLAIDASSFVPILAGLARDPAIRGTVVVAFADGSLAAPEHEKNIADDYETRYEEQEWNTNRFDFLTIENTLTRMVRSHLRSYADGARPISSLLTRILPASITPQYAIFLPDRSRLADYSNVDVPTVYYNRVIRQLHQNVVIPAGTEYSVIDAQLRARIDALTPSIDTLYLQRAASVAADAATIEARGGHVVFVVMPTNGLITAMESKLFPRQEFWDRFAAMTHSRTVHFEDVPSLKRIPVPDGSHVDYHARAALTVALLDAIGMGATSATNGAQR